MKKSVLIFLISTMVMPIFGRDIIVTIMQPDAVILDQKGSAVPKKDDGIFSIPVSIVNKSYVAKAPGFDPQQFTVTTKSTSMKIDLKPNIKHVTINIVGQGQENAKIFVDGVSQGIGTAKFNLPKGGSSTVTVSLDGYETYSTKVSFGDQHSVNMSYDIELVQNRQTVTVQLSNDITKASFFLDGRSVGEGSNNASFTINKGDTKVLKIQAPGYIDYITNVAFSNEKKEQFINLEGSLSEDEAYTMSVEGADIANTNITISVGPKFTREEVFRKIKMYLSDAFETSFDVSDSDVGWARTVWVQQVFPTRRVRTRAEIKELPDSKPGALKYKLIIKSEESDPKLDKGNDENFKPWNRVLKKYSNLPEIIKNAVEGN